MDQLTVDLGPGAEDEVGDPVVLLGAQGEQRVTAEELARARETINYEIVTAVGARVPRAVLGDEGDEAGGAALAARGAESGGAGA
jgi:alanine racemase